MQVIDVLVILDDESADRLVDQHAPRHAQQGGGGKVRLQDQPLFADGDTGHRRQVIEVEIARPLGVQFRLSPVQFLILHLPLDLMHAQFVERPPHFLGRHGLKVFLRLGHLSQGDVFGPVALGLP